MACLAQLPISHARRPCSHDTRELHDTAPGWVGGIGRADTLVLPFDLGRMDVRPQREDSPCSSRHDSLRTVLRLALEFCGPQLDSGRE